MAKIFAILCLIVNSSITFNESTEHSQSDPLTETKVLSGKVSMLIPKTFTRMTSEMLAVKYPNAYHRPTEVYTNEPGSINIALNHTANGAAEKDLPEIKKAMESQFNRPPMTFIKGEIKTINGKQFVLLEFVSPATDTTIYNLMAITVLEGRIAIITFNCTQDKRMEWETAGKKIINSIVTK